MQSTATLRHPSASENVPLTVRCPPPSDLIDEDASVITVPSLLSGEEDAFSITQQDDADVILSSLGIDDDGDAQLLGNSVLPALNEDGETAPSDMLPCFFSFDRNEKQRPLYDSVLDFEPMPVAAAAAYDNDEAVNSPPPAIYSSHQEAPTRNQRPSSVHHQPRCTCTCACSPMAVSLSLLQEPFLVSPFEEKAATAIGRTNSVVSLDKQEDKAAHDDKNMTCEPVVSSGTASSSNDEEGVTALVCAPIVSSSSFAASSSNTVKAEILVSKDDDGSDSSIVPTQNDVLLGKGAKRLHHNRHFTNLCAKYAQPYTNTAKRGRTGKKGIALTIVREIQEGNGRFLKSAGPGKYAVISDEAAAEKVSHCIRDLLRKHGLDALMKLASTLP